MKPFQVDTSLSEVHNSVDTTTTSIPVWKRVLSFFGPAYLVSVGYMDPGNWATDLAGGSQFGYKLMWVLLMSNLFALLLQSLSARLGIVRGRDLAQANRETYPKAINFCLYLLAEIAIAACDLAEVLGMAIGIQLLSGIPLLWAVLITLLDTFLLLALQRYGMRKMEAFIIGLIAIIAASFLIEIIMAKPAMGEVVKGLIPSLPNSTALYIAIGIIGATVMPHNLYLHSALVQTRKIKRDEKGIRRALNLNLADSAIALNLAFFVNAAILILAATVFFYKGRTDVAEIKQAHQLLNMMLGSKLAPILFAVALIAAGQSSTITGTLAGQIVMEGYLRLRISPWIRRLLTRFLAITPAVIAILLNGEKDINGLLIMSQVVLSLQLGFAMIPLIHFVSDKKEMGTFAIKPIIKVLAWLITSVLVYLNLKMVLAQALGYFSSGNSIIWKILLAAGIVFFIGLLVITFFYPLLYKKKRELPVPVHKPSAVLQELTIPSYNRIAIALDFSTRDEKLLAYAISLASPSTEMLLIHIVESATAKVFGSETDDFETRTDQGRLDEYVGFLHKKGFVGKTFLGYHNRNTEIPKIVNESKADLLIIGAHGHKGVKDWIYGQTIDAVRHRLQIPVFIV